MASIFYFSTGNLWTHDTLRLFLLKILRINPAICEFTKVIQ
jgi:hypothetical protein